MKYLIMLSLLSGCGINNDMKKINADLVELNIRLAKNQKALNEVECLLSIPQSMPRNERLVEIKKCQEVK